MADLKPNELGHMWLTDRAHALRVAARNASSAYHGASPMWEVCRIVAAAYMTAAEILEVNAAKLRSSGKETTLAAPTQEPSPPDTGLAPSAPGFINYCAICCWMGFNSSCPNCHGDRGLSLYVRASAKAEQAPRPPHCWHCLAQLQDDPPPRCDSCPEECDDPDCKAEGCVAELAAHPGVCPSGRASKSERAQLEPTNAINEAASRIISYMLDRGPIAPSSELNFMVRQELTELARRLGVADGR